MFIHPWVVDGVSKRRVGLRCVNDRRLAHNVGPRGRRLQLVARRLTATGYNASAQAKKTRIFVNGFDESIEPGKYGPGKFRHRVDLLASGIQTTAGGVGAQVATPSA